MCDAARCAPCTWAPLRWQCLYLGRKCSTFTFTQRAILRRDGSLCWILLKLTFHDKVTYGSQYLSNEITTFGVHILNHGRTIYNWKNFSTAFLNLNLDLELWKVNSHENWTCTFREVTTVIDEPTNEPTKSRDHNSPRLMYQNTD